MKSHFNLTLVRLEFLILFIFSTFFDGHAAFPPVRNFSRAAYSWGTQNWAIAQDSLGLVYLGNKNGLMVFDSKTFHRKTIDNHSTIRCILIDNKNGRAYTGGSEDFGYFDISHSPGRLDYVSLSPLLPENTPGFGEIWNVHKTGKEIIFQGDHTIFHLDENENIRAIDLHEKITFSKMINGRLYVALQGHGFGQLKGHKIETIDDGGLLQGKRIVSMQHIRNTIFIITEHNGIYTYDFSGIKPLKTSVDSFLVENQAFCAATNENVIAIGTVNKGLVIWNPIDDSASFVNTECGMQNNTVLSVAFDRDNNIWCGLDNGIDYILYDSPYKNMFGINGNYGAGYVSYLNGGKLYLGTNQGLYVTPYPLDASPRQADVRRLIQGQIWSIEETGNLLVCSDGGLYEINGDAVSQIKKVPGSWAVRQLKSDPDYALVSTYDNFHLIHREPDGHWTSRGAVAGFNDCNGRFHIDSDNNIWICHWLKGIYRLHLDLRSMRIDHVRFFDTTRGLPSNANTSIWEYENMLVFSTEGGYYRYNAATDRMEPHEPLKMFAGQSSPHLYNAPTGDLWSVTPDNIFVGRKKISGAIDIDSVSYSSLGSKIIPGFDNFNFINGNRLIVASLDGFLDVDLDRVKAAETRTPAILKSIYSGQDSLIYSSGINEDGKNTQIEVPYSLNSLRFEFISPEFRIEQPVQYSYYLENYDPEWSPYSNASVKEYTQLPEGTYTLRVRARNSYTKTTSEDFIRFSILPPWYMSMPAKISYALIILLIAWAVYDRIKRSQRHAADVLEKRKEKEMNDMKRMAQEESLRKDYEIADLKNQQLEQDVKHKGEELSNITMNVVRKNEILINIAGRLSKIQRNLAGQSIDNDTKAEFTRIQNIIQENISHDDDWRTFTHNFDAAYEDFTKRIRALHPGLTPTELRVCCYLRMGLSSKEMAPLFNISYRSVEMTRYRLRKKLDLGREVNLSDYLRDI